MVEGAPYKVRQSGECLVIDGTKFHRSLPFEGERYSIIAFLHNATWSLNRPELTTLRSLGYPLGGDMSLALSRIGADARRWVSRSGWWDDWGGVRYRSKCL